MNHIRNILSGIFKLFTCFQPRSYEPSNSNGFKEDADNLSRDVRMFGENFTQSTNSIYSKTTPGISKDR